VPQLSDVMRSDPIVVAPEDTLGEVAERMSGANVGAVIVKDGRIIAEGCNRVTSTHDPTAHAEIVALQQAARELGHWRVTGSVLVVTLEPCPMCAGAIVNAMPPATNRNPVSRWM